MNIERLPKILLRYLWFLILVVFATSAIAYYILSKQPLTYKVTTQLLVGPSLDSPSPDLNSLKIGGQLILTYAELAGTRSFLEAVNNKLDKKLDLDELDSLISVKQNTETRILTIVAYSEDPEQALAIASAAADVFVEKSPSKDNTVALLRDRMGAQTRQLEEIVEEANTNIRKFESELVGLKAIKSDDPDVLKFNIEQQNIIVKQLADEKGRLSDTLRTLATLYEILLDTNTNQVAVVEPAKEYTSLDQNLPVRVATAGASGLFVALAIVFLVEILDDRIRFPEDFNKATGSTVLGIIRKKGRGTGFGIDKVEPINSQMSEVANDYDELSTKLAFYAKESSSNLFLLSSTGLPTGVDAAVVAGNLAIASAKAGNKVVLIDTQTESSELAKLFPDMKMDDVKEHSFGNIKIKKISDFVSGVDFYPIGMLQDSDSILNSKKFLGVVENLKKDADFVLIVAPSFSWSSKGLMLASLINAKVIFVTRPAETRIKVVLKVVESLRELKVPVVGLIFDHNALVGDHKPLGALLFRRLTGKEKSLQHIAAP